VRLIGGCQSALGEKGMRRSASPFLLCGILPEAVVYLPLMYDAILFSSASIFLFSLRSLFILYETGTVEIPLRPLPQLHRTPCLSCRSVDENKKQVSSGMSILKGLSSCSQ
jgi:hypothetical protein